MGHLQQNSQLSNQGFHLHNDIFRGSQTVVVTAGSYFHYSVPGGWTEPVARDISPAPGMFGRGDPMYVCSATKKQ